MASSSYDASGIDGGRIFEKAAQAAENLKQYQEEELALLDLYAKRKAAQIELLAAEEERAALAAIKHKTEADKERIKELRKQETQLKKELQTFDNKLQKEKEQFEEAYYKKRTSNLQSLANRQLELNRKIANEDLAVEDKVTEEKLRNSENIFNLRTSMLADLKILEEAGLKDVTSSGRDFWTKLNKEKRDAIKAEMKDSKKFQDLQEQRDSNLHKAKVKNITARADWEINQANIVANNSLQKHEQRNAKILDLEIGLETSRADRTSFIEDTIEQRRLEGQQKVADAETQLALERQDLANEVDRQIEAARLAGLKRVIEAEKLAAKYRGGSEGSQETKDANVQKMVEADSKARHADSDAKVAKNEYDLKLFNYDEETQILDAITEATSASNFNLAKQRREQKIAERDHDRRVLEEIEKAEIAAGKRIQDAKLKADSYTSMTAEQRVKRIADINKAVNTEANSEISKKQLDLDARRANKLNAARKQRKNEELAIETEIITNEEALRALQYKKEDRYSATTKKKKSQYDLEEEKADQAREQAKRDRAMDIQHAINMQAKKHSQEMDDLDKAIEQEQLNRAATAIQTIEKLKEDSQSRIEKAQTKQVAYTGYSEKEMAAASPEDRAAMEAHNLALETYKTNKANSILDEQRANLAEGLVNTEAEILALRNQTPEDLHQAVLKEIKDSEKSALSAINAAKLKAAKYQGGDDNTSAHDKQKNKNKLMHETLQQDKAQLKADLSEMSFTSDYKEKYANFLNYSKNLKEQEETRGKLVDLANETAYYEKYATDIALRKVKTDASSYANKVAQLKAEAQAFQKYTAAQMAAADDETRAKMKAHNIALDNLETEKLRAAEAERLKNFAEEHFNTEVRIKELRNTSKEEIEMGGAKIFEDATESTLQALKKARMEQAAYTTYSQSEIDAEADPEKKAKMQEHNTKLSQHKEDSIEAKLAEIQAANAKKRFDTELAVDPRVLKAEEDAKHEDAWMSELQAKPGDANYSLTSMSYQNDVAEALAKATKADGSVDQNLYDQEMELIRKKYSTEGELYKKHLKDLTKLEEVERIQAVRDAELAPLKEKADLNKKKKDGVVSDFKTAFNPGMLLGGLLGDEDAKKATSGAMGRLFKDDEGNFDMGKALSSAISGLSSVLRNLEHKMGEVGKYQAPIDTRLYGSSHTFMGTTGIFTAMAAASPVLLQSDLMDSMLTLVNQGISHNVQLRAYLDVASKKIATTFEVADSTLLKLVRIQQADTTMARLGMESALNAFLNNMYETTEYLSSLADSVRANLYEAQALMEAKDATEFEFQVQKWLGSMHSVGMSDEAVSSISTALGQLAAGQIEALTGGGAGNLMVMAANAAGLSLGEILADGLDSKQTNKLLEASVEYLADIANRSDSKVVQQELAKIFGVTAADLKAIGNLTDGRTVKNISKKNLGYGGMIAETIMRDLTAFTRTNMGEMLNNVWENLQWTMAAGMASNPVSYLMFKMANLLEDATGGIDLPFLNVYGFGVELNTSVAQLMQVGAMAGGIMSSLAMGIAGLASSVDILGSLGAGAGLKKIARGDGGGGGASGGASTSSSGSLVANGSGGDMKAATMAEAAADIAKQSIQGKEDNEDATRDDIIEFLMKQFQILFGKFDLSISALKLQGLTIGDKIKDTNEAQNVLMGGWSNGSVSSMSGTTKTKM